MMLKRLARTMAFLLPGFCVRPSAEDDTPHSLVTGIEILDAAGTKKFKARKYVIVG